MVNHAGYVLFHLSDQLRQSSIDKHSFYVEQARKRLFSQFNDIEAEADSVGKEWLKRNSNRFDPERHDSSDFDEVASDKRIEHYELLSNMRDQTRLFVVAGMFHEWDKQLRDWLVREIHRSFPGGNAASAVWSAKFGDITDLLEHLGWKIRSADYFHVLDACRLVVNVYKHGDGPSAKDLKQNCPEYFDGPVCASGGTLSKYCNHTHLKVSDDQLQAFADAIVAFWQGVPKNVFESDVEYVPDWLGKAIEKDQGASSKSNPDAM